MSRISMKSSRYFVLMMTFMLVCAATLAFGELQLGTAIGPGVGGQVHSFAFDPANPNVFYAGGDVCGVYKYDKTNGKWTPWSNGLGLNEIGRAFYVDDLLVVRGLTGAGEVNNGVYAATQGGLWFRHGDSSRWVCVSKKADGNYATYDKGYAFGVLHYAFDSTSGHPAIQKIPFASLAFDADTGMLYAGAGSARVGGTKNFYPRTNYPQSGSPGNPPDDEYALWQMNLNSAAPSISVVEGSQGVTGCGYGYARQVAVVSYTDSEDIQRRVVAAACESKVFIKELGPAAAPCQVIWPVSSADKSILGESISEEPWGVAAGSRGRLYVSTRRDPGDPTNPNLRPGVYVQDLKTKSWSEVLGDDGGLWLPNATLAPTTWINFLRDDTDPLKRDLTELSVYPKDSGQDEIFIGIGRVNADDYGDCGYVRCGNYNTTAAGDSKYGWAYVHCSKNSQILLADWQHLPIQANLMGQDQIGWHRFYPKLQALVPFAIHPDPAHADIMVGIDYGIPMVSWNGSTSWSNLYCTGPDAGDGWQNIGLNLLCPRSSGLKSDGRLVIGAADYGVFRATTPLNDYFQMLHVPTTRGNPLDFPDAVDVEIVKNGGHDEIYMVDEIDDPDGNSVTHENADIYVWPDVDGTTDWQPVTNGIETDITGNRERLAITEVAFISPNRMIAAVGVPTSDGGCHFYLREGSRSTGSAAWTWGKYLDVDAAAGSHQTKVITDLCAIPNTNKVLYSAKTKTYGTPVVASAGGVYAVDWGAGPSSPLGAVDVWFGGDSLLVDCTDAACKLGKHVSALAVDPAGHYVYAGCSRPDSAWELGRGGVVRFELNAGTKINVEILSGTATEHFPLNSRALYAAAGLGAMECWEWCTNVTDIAIDPREPAICYVAVNNHSYIDDETGVWRFANGSWTHVWGGGELGAGAWTVDVSANGYTLYIGAVGLEYFTMSVPGAQMGTAPHVAENAEYPVMRYSNGSGANVFAVHVDPANDGSVQSVYAEGRDLGNVLPGSVPLKDDGVAPDLIAGDGLYTSNWLMTHISAVSGLNVKVTAIGGDANYAVTNVHVNVIDTAPAVVVDGSASYRMLAGSTGHMSSFAVGISSAVPVPEARINVTVNDSMLVIRDNGQNGDDVAGDGIYTSAEFVAPDGWQPMVLPHTCYGYLPFAPVSVEAVDNKAKFANVSESSTGLRSILTDAPYSAVYFKSKPGVAQSADLMVVTFDNAHNDPTTPAIMQRITPVDGVPQFEDKTFSWFGGSRPLAGSRGVCYADFDNDGDNDLFICNPYYGGRLYRNDLDSGGKFEDVTNTVFVGADRDAISQAITASWGDYNGDGFVDLFVANTNYFGSVKLLSPSMAADQLANLTYSTCVFKNVHGATFKKHVTASVSGANNVCLAGSWVDLDNDGDLDLVRTKLIGGAIVCLENIGFVESIGDNVLAPYGQFMPIAGDPDAFSGVNSVSVIDYDHNEFPDLLVTYATYTAYPKTKILLNNSVTGSRTFTPIDVEVGTEWSGAAVGDFDLNGQEDILLLPRNADTPPGLFMADAYSTTAPHYRDLGHAVGLRHGVTGGALAADFDNDGNIDLFLGRTGADAGQPGSGKFLYRNAGQAAGASSANWVGVRLTSLGNSNRSLIGTRVIVTAGDKRWTKFVDGGSGRGGQSSNELRFGLGSDIAGVAIRVEYPSGSAEDRTSNVLLNQYNDFAETAGVTIESTTSPSPSPVCTFDLGPGTSDFVFKWRTIGNKGDMKADAVTIKQNSAFTEGGACDVGIPVGQALTIAWGHPNTDFQIYKDGNGWRHVVRWRALPCGVDCGYKFKVTSGVGTVTTQSPSWRATTTPTFCVPRGDDMGEQ